MKPPSGCPTAVSRPTPSECPPAAPLGGNSFLRTVDSTAYRGCSPNQPQSPRSTARLLPPLLGWPSLLEGLPDFQFRNVKRLCLGHGLLPLPVDHLSFALSIFPLHPRSGSQVPYESLNESHAPYTPDAVWPVSLLQFHTSSCCWCARGTRSASV
jgi:hypothetical protein